MTPPVQTLPVVARLFPAILDGEKTHTIRWREGEIRPGPLCFACDGDPGLTALVEVTRVTDLPLAKAAGFLGRSAEWPDAVMLEGMREHYPGIGLDSIVQVVEFRLR